MEIPSSSPNYTPLKTPSRKLNIGADFPTENLFSHTSQYGIDSQDYDDDTNGLNSSPNSGSDDDHHNNEDHRGSHDESRRRSSKSNETAELRKPRKPRETRKRLRDPELGHEIVNQAIDSETDEEEPVIRNELMTESVIEPLPQPPKLNSQLNKYKQSQLSDDYYTPPSNNHPNIE